MDVQRRMNINVFLLGLSFLLLFTAFQTMSNVMTVIIENAANETSAGAVEGFDGKGYVSLSIIYGVFAVCNWIAPSVMALVGMKITMILGAAGYALFVASFFLLKEEILYTASAVIGVGAALIWTAQGTFLTVNSEPETMARNSGIFWAMFTSASLIGNTYAFFQFSGSEDISTGTRNIFVLVLSSVAAAGFLCFFTLLPTPWAKEQLKESMESPLKALKGSLALILTADMLQLIFHFFYMGMESTFWSGVFGPSLGFTNNFENSNSLPGLHGIMIGVGEITSGALIGLFGQKLRRFGRWPVVACGTVAQFAAYGLAFLNLPNEAPLGNTNDYAIIRPSSVALAIVSSLLLGFGDGCYNTQTIALLGEVYPDKAGPAFAMFKFVQSSASAIGFGYAGVIPLYWHIGMLWLVGAVGTILFIKIDVQLRRGSPRRDRMMSIDEKMSAVEERRMSRILASQPKKE